MKLKRIISILLLACLLVLLAPTSLASTSFSDVNETDWYYNQIMAMTEKGLFKGKGNNMFCPNDTMTKAEFIAVLVRTLYPEKDLTARDGEPWWGPVYNEAVNANIITWIYTGRSINQSNMLYVKSTAMEEVVTRQEMAALVVRTLMARGETLPEPYMYVGDYTTADKLAVASIRLAYAAGIIVGDEYGRFNPRNTLTRAEASTVLYRIIEKSERRMPQTESITIYEGQTRFNRNAKPGDIFVKKDGTQIVLKLDQYGILGGGQGVAADVGLFGMIREKGKDQFWFNQSDYPDLTDSTGKNINNQDYYINATTGEGYWLWEYHKLCEIFPRPERDGYYVGEVSPDPYHLYIWDGGDWYYNKLPAVYR